MRVWNILDYLQAQCEYRRPVIVVAPSVRPRPVLPRAAFPPPPLPFLRPSAYWCLVFDSLPHRTCLQSPDSIKRRFANMLVEDSCRGMKSYADFLCSAHTLIQNKFLE